MRRHPADAFGLVDTARSVAEWCQDWFDRDDSAASPSENPRGPVAGMCKIVSGRAWSDGPNRITVFFRNWTRPIQPTLKLGLR